MWERGLKRQNLHWSLKWYVAPHVGAWIETENLARVPVVGGSLPMWERGLKLLALEGVAA